MGTNAVKFSCSSEINALQFSCSGDMKLIEEIAGLNGVQPAFCICKWLSVDKGSLTLTQQVYTLVYNVPCFPLIPTLKWNIFFRKMAKRCDFDSTLYARLQRVMHASP